MQDHINQILAKRDLDIVQQKNKSTGLYEYKTSSSGFNQNATTSPMKKQTQKSQINQQVQQQPQNINVSPLLNSIFLPRSTFQSHASKRSQRGYTVDNNPKVYENQQNKSLPYVTTNQEYGSTVNNSMNKHSRLKSANDLTKNPSEKAPSQSRKESEFIKLKDLNTNNINVTGNQNELKGLKSSQEINPREIRSQSQQLDKKNQQNLNNHITGQGSNNFYPTSNNNNQDPNQNFISQVNNTLSIPQEFDIASSAGKFCPEENSELGQERVLDLTMLENLSMNDQKLYKLVRKELSELNSNQGLDLEQIQEKLNQIRHNYKNAINSVYRKDFSVKSDQSQIPPLYQTKYDSLSQQQRDAVHFDPSYKTTNKADFIEKPLPQKQSPQPYVHQPKPISCMTTYGANFIDWRNYDPGWNFKRPQLNENVGEKVPMDCQTIYKATLEKDIKRKAVKNYNAEDIKRFQKDCPIPQVYKDDISSSYLDKYKHHTNLIQAQQTGINGYTSQITDRQVVENLTWQGQFQSNSKRTYKKLDESDIKDKQSGVKIKLLSKLRNSSIQENNNLVINEKAQ